MQQATKTGFYVAIRACGCVRATLVDDEDTSAKDLADFARRAQKANYRVAHREMTLDEFRAACMPCGHNT